jgi:hypothetical protein
MSAKHSKDQIEWARNVLNNPSALEASLGSYVGEHSTHLLDQLKAKVILGEFRQDSQQNDWVVARANLTASDQAELRKLLEED